MFFFGYDRMVGLQHFPSLQILCIMGQSIDRIKGLTYVPLLTELWISECQLQVRICFKKFKLKKLSFVIAFKLISFVVLVFAQNEIKFYLEFNSFDTCSCGLNNVIQ